MKSIKNIGLLVLCLCLLVGSHQAGAMQVTRQEAELLQTEHVFEEQIESCGEKMWERIRALVMLWCGVATADTLLTSVTADAKLLKGHTKTAYVFGSLAALVTLRELVGMVRDLRKINEYDQLIQLVRQQLVDLEDKRRLRRPAVKLEEAPADTQSQN